MSDSERDYVQNKTIALLKETTGLKDPISLDTVLSTLGDSLSLTEWQMDLEREFEIEIDPSFGRKAGRGVDGYEHQTLTGLLTVSDAVNYIIQKRAESHAQANKPEYQPGT